MSNAPLLPTLALVDSVTASARQKEILDVAHKQLGFIPNMYLGMANAPAVLDTYLHGYGLFRAESGFRPAEQEVVFLAVSAVNDCRYCTAAHSMIADKKSGVAPDVLQAIRSGATIPHARLRALFDFTQAMVRSQGAPARSAVDDFLAAGFDEVKVLYVILAIAVKTLSNYSNHAFATPVDDRFAAYRLT